MKDEKLYDYIQNYISSRDKKKGTLYTHATVLFYNLYLHLCYHALTSS